MSEHPSTDGRLRERPIDPWLVERLIEDPSSAADNDERALAGLFAALLEPSRDDLAEQADYLAAFDQQASALVLGPDRASTRRKPGIGAVLAAKTVVAAAALATLTLATAAAALTGSLPAPLQAAADRAVGASARHSDQGGTEPTGSAAGRTIAAASARPTAKPGQGPNVNDRERRGLCTAFRHGGLGRTSTGYLKLAREAGGDDQVDTFCRRWPDDQTGRRIGPVGGGPAIQPTGRPTDPDPSVDRPGGGFGDQPPNSNGQPGGQPPGGQQPGGQQPGEQPPGGQPPGGQQPGWPMGRP
jgi:hypothetical protein